MIVLLLSFGCVTVAEIETTGAPGLTVSPPEDTDESVEAGDTDTPDTPPDPETDAPEDTAVPEDTGVTFVPDGMTCYTLSPRDSSVALVAVDMDTATLTDVMVWSGLGTTSSFHVYGMTRDATGFATIGYDGNGFTFYHLDLDGTASVGRSTGSSDVTWTGTEYLLLHSGGEPLLRCATWADVQTGTCTASGTLFAGNSRLTTDGVEVYGAWHSTSEVDVYDLGTLARSRTIPLEDWATWIMGMSVAAGSLFVIDDGRQYADQRIVEFDPSTGLMRNRVFLPGPSGRAQTGLWCSDAAL